eukprot:Polyplicarium_translucidae@DN1033_c0_g1_i1.p1
MLRAKIVNAFWWIQSEFSLRTETVHLAVALFDRVVAMHLEHDADGRGGWIWTALDGQACRAAATACIKIADVFNETSKEYYKQDNAQEYALLVNESRSGLFKGTTIDPAQLLVIEKKILAAVNFRPSVPTTTWFDDAYTALAGLRQDAEVMSCLRYLSDIGLLDNALLTFSPSLRSQVALLMASCHGYRPVIDTNGRILQPHLWDMGCSFACIGACVRAERR